MLIWVLEQEVVLGCSCYNYVRYDICTYRHEQVTDVLDLNGEPFEDLCGNHEVQYTIEELIINI